MRKKLKIAGFSVSIILVVVAVILLYPLMYKGSDDIIIAEDHNFSSLKDIISQDRFKDKTVFIDMWGTTCAPCIKEFDYAGELKERYKDEAVEFLYLCSIDRIDHKVRWKDIIKQKQLAGYHVPIDGTLYESIWDKHLSEPIESKYWIPRYFIVKGGNIVIGKAAHPSSKDKLYNQIDSVLNLK